MPTDQPEPPPTEPAVSLSDVATLPLVFGTVAALCLAVVVTAIIAT